VERNDGDSTCYGDSDSSSATGPIQARRLHGEDAHGPNLLPCVHDNLYARSAGADTVQSGV